ncbi:gas vesicle protein GvpJ [Streptomyces sp. NPDC050560]|uniref:gas vesicle protein GvpJ n=1 Tax=Streptomyces sp. NPDC050560 TaxID=3365630 RepID=UPI0037A81446
MTTTTYNEAAVCVPRAGTLYDVLELILDRGMVIDVFVRVSLVGIEILKVDARIVVASVDTYLRFAEVCNRLDLNEDASSRTVPELFFGASSGAAGRLAGHGAKRTARSVGGKIKEAVGMDDDAADDDSAADDADTDDERGEREPAPRRRAAPASRAAGRGVGARSRRTRERDT